MLDGISGFILGAAGMLSLTAWLSQYTAAPPNTSMYAGWAFFLMLTLTVAWRFK